jgi:hypothetical protein
MDQPIAFAGFSNPDQIARCSLLPVTTRLRLLRQWELHLHKASMQGLADPHRERARCLRRVEALMLGLEMRRAIGA